MQISLFKEKDRLAASHARSNGVGLPGSVEILHLLLLKCYFNNKKFDAMFELVTFQSNKENKVKVKNISE